MLTSALSPYIAASVIISHKELPIAVWIVCEPALADEELQHRAQWPDCF